MDFSARRRRNSTSSDNENEKNKVLILAGSFILLLLVIGLVWVKYTGNSSESERKVRESVQVLGGSSKSDFNIETLVNDVSLLLRKEGVPHWLVMGSLRHWKWNGSLQGLYVVEMGYLRGGDLSPLGITLAQGLPGSEYVVLNEADFGVQIVHKNSGCTVELLRFEVNEDGKTLDQKSPHQWLQRMYSVRHERVSIDHVFPIQGANSPHGTIEVPIPANVSELTLFRPSF